MARRAGARYSWSPGQPKLIDPVACALTARWNFVCCCPRVMTADNTFRSIERASRGPAATTGVSSHAVI
jgi:hypothetical protein